MAAPDLEERVAALEACLAPGPLLKPFGMPPLTEEQEAQLKRDFDETMRGPFTPHFLPSVPPLTPDQVRHLLRECVTVVKPGEVLVVRVPVTWKPSQVREYQEHFSSAVERALFPFNVIVAAADELGIIEDPGGVPGAA